LVRDGKEYVNKSKAFEGVSQSFINLKAPRVAIGHNSKGELVMFHTNGYFSDEPGVDLYEVVQILSKFDVVNAVNLE
jgi:N-acetylglucosamine-1-phosphodiester alpha-N-acetylglucosaminidase